MIQIILVIIFLGPWLSKSTIIKIEILLNETCDYLKQLNGPQPKGFDQLGFFHLRPYNVTISELCPISLKHSGFG